MNPNSVHLPIFGTPSVSLRRTDPWWREDCGNMANQDFAFRGLLFNQGGKCSPSLPPPGKLGREKTKPQLCGGAPRFAPAPHFGPHDPRYSALALFSCL